MIEWFLIENVFEQQQYTLLNFFLLIMEYQIRKKLITK